MNKQGREQIKTLNASLSAIRDGVEMANDVDEAYDERLGRLVTAQTDLESVSSDVSDLQGEEQDKYDNMSEGLQGSERGEAIQAAAEALSNAESELDGAIGDCDDAIEALKKFNLSGAMLTDDEIEEMVTAITDQIDEAVGALDEAAQ